MPINYQLGKIYDVINDVNDILYTGSTALPRLSTRMVAHRSASKNNALKSNFHAAMAEIGAEHFRIVLNHAFPCTSKDELVAEEMRTINAHKAGGKTMYNTMIDNHHAEDTKLRIAKAHIGMVHSDEAKALMRAARAKVDQHGDKSVTFNYGSIRYQATPGGHGAWRFKYQVNGVGTLRGWSTKKHGFWQAKLLAEAERKRVYPEWKSDEEVATEGLMAIDID